MFIHQLISLSLSLSPLPLPLCMYKGNGMSVDESSFTGECDLIAKNNDRDPILLASTRVMEGEGTILVSAVGPHSQQGILVTLMSQPEEERKGIWYRKYGNKS